MNDAEAIELAARVGAALQARKLMLATAESCTGGMIAAAITAIAGSSEWFDRGIVSYSNDAKVELLGVPDACLATFGAVSEPTARAMADGAIARSSASVAVAVTGIAGPGGGSADKPVGMVCFGWAVRGAPTEVETIHFPGDRATVRAMTVCHALLGILKRLDSNLSGQ
jgi:nicotinamide-nucleotide amidase